VNTRGIIPLIDLGFLTLGAVVALLAESEFLERLPIDLAQAPGGVERADAPVEHLAVSVTADEVFIDGAAVPLGEVASRIAGRDAVVRPAADIDAARLLVVLRELAGASSVQIEHEPLR
jgi:hypothetical protein